MLLFIYSAIFVNDVLVNVTSVSMYDAKGNYPYKEPNSRNRDVNK